MTLPSISALYLRKGLVRPSPFSWRKALQRLGYLRKATPMDPYGKLGEPMGPPAPPEPLEDIPAREEAEKPPLGAPADWRQWARERKRPFEPHPQFVGPPAPPEPEPEAPEGVPSREDVPVHRLPSPRRRILSPEEAEISPVTGRKLPPPVPPKEGKKPTRRRAVREPEVPVAEELPLAEGELPMEERQPPPRPIDPKTGEPVKESTAEWARRVLPIYRTRTQPPKAETPRTLGGFSEEEPEAGPRQVRGTRPEGFRPREMRKPTRPTPEQAKMSVEDWEKTWIRSHEAAYNVAKSAYEAWATGEDPKTGEPLTPEQKAEFEEVWKSRHRQMKEWAKRRYEEAQEMLPEERPLERGEGYVPERLRKPVQVPFKKMSKEELAEYDRWWETIAQRYGYSEAPEMENYYESWRDAWQKDPNSEETARTGEHLATLIDQMNKWKQQEDQYGEVDPTTRRAIQIELELERKKKPKSAATREKEKAERKRKREEESHLSRGEYYSRKLDDLDFNQRKELVGRAFPDLLDKYEAFTGAFHRDYKALKALTAQLFGDPAIENMGPDELVSYAGTKFKKISNEKDRMAFMELTESVRTTNAGVREMERTAFDKEQMEEDGSLREYFANKPGIDLKSLSEEEVKKARSWVNMVRKNLDRSVTRQANQIFTDLIAEGLRLGKFDDNPEIKRQAESIVKHNNLLRQTMPGGFRYQYVPGSKEPKEGGFLVGERLYSKAYHYIWKDVKSRGIDASAIDAIVQGAITNMWEKMVQMGVGLQEVVPGKEGLPAGLPAYKRGKPLEYADIEKYRNNTWSTMESQKVEEFPVPEDAPIPKQGGKDIELFQKPALDEHGNPKVDKTTGEPIMERWGRVKIDTRDLYHFLSGELIVGIYRAGEKLKKGKYQGKKDIEEIFAHLSAGMRRTGKRKGRQAVPYEPPPFDWEGISPPGVLEVEEPEEEEVGESGLPKRYLKEAAEEEPLGLVEMFGKGGEELTHLPKLLAEAEKATSDLIGPTGKAKKGVQVKPENLLIPTLASIILPHMKPKERIRGEKAAIGPQIVDAAKRALAVKKYPKEIESALRKLGTEAAEAGTKESLVRKAASKLSPLAEIIWGSEGAKLTPERLLSIDVEDILSRTKPELLERDARGNPKDPDVREFLETQADYNRMIEGPEGSRAEQLQDYRGKVADYFKIMALIMQGKTKQALALAEKKSVAMGGIVKNFLEKMRTEGLEGKSFSGWRGEKRIRCPDGTPMSRNTRTCAGREGFIPWTEEERLSNTLSEPPKGPTPQRRNVHGRYPNKSFTIRPSPFGRKK